MSATTSTGIMDGAATKELSIESCGLRGMVEVGRNDTLATVRLKIVEEWDKDMIPTDDFCLWVGPTRLSRKQEARKNAWDYIGAVDTASTSSNSNTPTISLQAKQPQPKSAEKQQTDSLKNTKQGSDNIDQTHKTKKGQKRAKPVMPTRNTSRKKRKNIDQAGANSLEKKKNGGVEPQAKLSYYVGTLSDLWKEYTQGIGGRKPAKLFTVEEIDRVKEEYHRRKLVWDIISQHVNAGYLPVDAIHKIHRAYAPILRVPTVPSIILAIQADVPRGGHPGLQITKKLLVAKLSKRPKTLWDLWTEYTCGGEDRKPAREFTAAERGAVKGLYSQRNLVWKIIEKHVQAGYIAPVAINKVYQVYGEGASNGTIIQGIRKDNKTGGHPTLRLP